MYHKAPLQLIGVLFYYTKQTAEMWLNNSELSSFFSPDSAHHCSAWIHISLNSSSTSRRWDMIKNECFHRLSQAVFSPLWLKYNFLPPIQLIPNVSWHFCSRGLKWKNWRNKDTLPWRIYTLLFMGMHQISGVHTCPYCVMRGFSNRLGELYG